MDWKVPLSDIVFDETEIRAVTDVLRSGWLSMGGVTQAFEAAFAAKIGARHAFAVTNCTTALHLAYAALDLQPGDEVIVPALSFVATANAVTYTGATPVFADVASTMDLTIDPADIERKITAQTKAIAVMHYGGYPCQMDAINALARRFNLAVVEDAAHAPGATYHGRPCGLLGDIAAFSFFSNKNLVTGEGGMITCHRDDLAEKVRLMRSHGMTTLTWDRHRGHAASYDVVAPGFNYRIDEMRSALGLAQLQKLEDNNQKRQEWVALYRRLLTEVEGVSVPFFDHPGSASHLMPVLLDDGIDRDGVAAAMKAAAIQTSMHYPPTHLFHYYQKRWGTGPGLLPVTEAVARREITLPLYPTMQTQHVEMVVTALAQSIQQA